MRKFIAIASFAALTGPTFAADMPVKAPFYNPSYYAKPSWTGFYVGGNVGYGWGTAASDYSLTVAGLLSVPLTSDVVSPRGIVAGGQIGYNFQTGNFVYGIEGDAQYSGQKGDSSAAGGLLCPLGLCAVFAPAGISLTHTEKITWFGTLRGRFGYDFGSTMVYGTAGLAVAGVESTLTATTPVASLSLSNSQNRVGWTLGGGFESMINRNWSWKAEYLYMDYGTYGVNYGLTVPVLAIALPATIHQSTKLTDNVVRLGLNYRF
jgi:outer membrane immunogenic protein